VSFRPRNRDSPNSRAAGLDPIPRPYDLRHSFASLLLAEGRQPLYVARQMGHSLAVLLSTYAHLIDEYSEGEPIDAEAEIADARGRAMYDLSTSNRQNQEVEPSPGKKNPRNN
jgi:hypothetical protein